MNAAKHPAWIRELKAKPPVKEQVTIIQAARKPDVRYTGAGPDGVVQPHLPISMVQTERGPQMLHEGEATIHQPCGRVDVVPQPMLQQIERSTGMPGMQAGGSYYDQNASMTAPAPTTGALPSAPAYEPIKAIANTGATARPEAPKQQETMFAPAPIMPQTSFTPQAIPTLAPPAQTMTAPAPTTTPGVQEQAPTQTMTAPAPTAGPLPSAPYYAPIQATPPAQPQTASAPAPTAEPISTPSIPIQPYNAEQATQQRALNEEYNSWYNELDPNFRSYLNTYNGSGSGPATWDEYRAWVMNGRPNGVFTPSAALNYRPPSKPDAVSSSQYQQDRDAALAALRDIMNGMSQVDRTIANRYLTAYDASSAAQSMELAQRISMDKNMSQGAKNALIARLHRNTAIGRAELSGNLAQGAQERAQGAIQPLFDMSTLAQTYDQFTAPANQLALESARTSLGSAQFADLNTRISNGATFEMVAPLLLASGLDANAARAAYDSMSASYRQAIESGSLMNISARMGIDAARMNSVVSAIQSDVPLALVNSTYGVNLTQEEYASIIKNHSLDTQVREANLLATRYGFDRTKLNDIIADARNNVPFEQLKEQIMALKPGMTEVEAEAFYNDVKRGEVTVNTGDRIGMFIEAGVGLQDIKQDDSIRKQVAKDLGVSINDPKVDKEIENNWNATVSRNSTVFQNRALDLIEDVIDTRGTADDAVNNKEIRNAMALSMRIDPADEAQRPTVEDRIRKEFALLSMPEPERIFNNYVDNGWVDPKYTDTPGWEGQFMSMIRDLGTANLIDSEGKLTPNEEINWPWMAPDTFHHYTDWNDEDIVYNADGTYPPGYSQTQVKFDGNGTTYYRTNSDGSKRPITFEDMNNMWNSLSKPDRARYYSNGKPDMKKLLELAGDPETISNPDGTSGRVLGSRLDYENFFADNPETLEELSEIVDAGVWQTSATYPPDYYIVEHQNKPIRTLDENVYVYYDENGKLSYGRTTRFEFKMIWQQLSDVFNGGKPLTPAQFDMRWKDGEGWLVNDQGIITNLKNPSAYGATPTSPTVDPVVIRRNAASSTATSIMDMYARGGAGNVSATPTDIELLVAHPELAVGEAFARPVDVSGDSLQLDQFDTLAWDGHNWALTSNTVNWVKQNVGKIYVANKTLYEVIGVRTAVDRNDAGYVVLKDVATGRYVGYNVGPGTDRPFTFLGMVQPDGVYRYPSDKPVEKVKIPVNPRVPGPNNIM